MIPRITPWRHRGNHPIAGSLAVLFLIEVTRSSYGQVVLDGKFGTSGAVAGPNFDLNSGMGAVRGNNLFHSFSQFDLKAGDVATFSGPANVQNILSRVTGGNPSSINGTIRSSIAGANFFLINPKGVMFGPKAAVNVTGSFAASTADYLKLADGARFMAALDADDSGLSTAPVSDFGFLGNTPGSIATEQSTLRGANGRTLSLVGGDISLSGGAVSSPAGRLDVVSVQSAGEVPVDPKTMTKSEFRAAFPQQGQVILQNGALADATGSGGGRVVIRGGRLTADNARIQANTTGTTAGQGIDIAVVHDLNLLNGGQINSLSPAGRGASGNIQVSAESIRLDGGGLVDASFNPKTQISTASGDLASGGGAAKGGDIVIQTGSLELVNSAQISSATYGAGNAGRIEIEASSVRLDALLTTPTQIVANSQRSTSVGNAGDILIRTESLDLVNGATILAASFGSGRAGLLDIKAESVNIFSGAIMTAGTFGSGSGGNVQITCESLRIDGRDILTGGQDFLTGIQAVTTSLFSPAPGGSIHVSADSLELANSASIFTSSYGIGPGGDIAITAGNLTLDHDSTIRASGEGAGRAGKISIFSSRDVVLTDKSAISTSAPQSSGGDIQLQAGNEIQLFNSQVTAQAGPGGGGNITLLAPSLIYMLDSTLTAQAVGDGGNLNIDPIFFILNRSSLVSKSSSANGGNITILSDYFLQSSSVIDASAPFGLPGTVSVSAPDVDLSGSLIGLPGSLLGAETQLRPDCGVRLAESISSFIVLGRGGLPFEPGGFVPSGLVSLWDEDQ